MGIDSIKWYSRIPGYHYHDTPEGEDCLKKTLFMAKAGLLTGVMVGTLDILGISKPVGAAAIAARYAKISYPIMAVTSTFGAVCCTSAHIRQKNDTFNYFLGGFSSGCVAGAVFKSGTFGTSAAVLFGIMACGYKEMEKHGIEIFKNSEPIPQTWYSIWSGSYDFSIFKEHPRGWKKSEDEEI